MQIRKALKRKHTLPNYKLRYKPFFPKSEPGGVDESGGALLSGVLQVTVLQVSRINESPGPIFCSLAVGKLLVSNFKVTRVELSVYKHL